MKYLVLCLPLLLACAPAPVVVDDKPPTESCSPESPDVCYAQGRELARSDEEGAGERSIPLFDVACSAPGFERRAWACTWFGLKGAYDDDVGERAREALGYACEQGVVTACTHWSGFRMGRAFRLGPTHPEGRALLDDIRGRLEPICVAPTPPEELAEFWILAHLYACSTVAPMYEHGMGVQRDRTRAFALWSRACDGGDPHGCAQTAFFHSKGWGTPRSHTKAREIYEKACDAKSAMACANLATVFLRGTEVKTDPARAVELLELPCSRGYLNSCDTLSIARALVEAGDDQGARVDKLMAALTQLVATRRSALTPGLDDGDFTDLEWVKSALATMNDVDQLYRRGMSPPGLDDAHRAQFLDRVSAELESVDKDNQRILKRIVKQWGFPTISKFGPVAAGNAWLIVQHADHDLPWQKQILAALEGLLETNDVALANYAYLWDRVAVNEGRKQRYGSQGHCVEGRWAPRPLEKPETVDELRTEVGLGPLAEYAAGFSESCR